MKVLLTGSTGYIAQRLLPQLIDSGHEIFCCVRDIKRFNSEKYNTALMNVIQADFLNRDSLVRIPKDIDVAYYLIHSMSSSDGDFEKLEEISATNFRDCIQQTNARQVIFLSGIVNEEYLSKHLLSRKNVERILASG
jgi:uncharacterized protein YbjT (DUF2867 family)